MTRYNNFLHRYPELDNTIQDTNIIIPVNITSYDMSAAQSKSINVKILQIIHRMIKNNVTDNYLQSSEDWHLYELLEISPMTARPTLNVASEELI